MQESLHLQFYCLVPHYNISRKNEGLNIYNVGISSLCSNIKPFTLERQMAVSNPGKEKQTKKKQLNIISTIFFNTFADEIIVLSIL